jgi:hypothetical protein
MIGDRYLLHRSWPNKSIDLLLKACILPLERARPAWRQWINTQNFDDVSWHEIRLLSALSTRIAELDPHSPFRPRIEGLARSHWTKTQFALRESTEAIDLLRRAGVPHLLIKGAAQYAEGLTSKTRRILADIDILVPPEQSAQAIDRLVTEGWLGANGESAAYLRSVADIRISINLLKGRYGEVDIHRSAFHYCRIDRDADDLLWKTAEGASLNGRSVMVPGPAASVLITLAHATFSHGGDWALDVAKRLDHCVVDWDLLTELTIRWRLNLPVQAGLLYLRDQLELAIPSAAVDRITRARSDWADRLKLWSNVHEREERSLGERLVNRLANRALRRRGYELPVPDRERLAVVRPRGFGAMAFRRARRLVTLRGEAMVWNTQAVVSLRAIDMGLKLAIEIEFQIPGRSRRIYFDVARGAKAFARIRTRAGGRRAGAKKRILAVMLLPLGENAEISIEARPTKFVRPAEMGRTLDLIDALPFRVVRAAII